MKILNAYGWIQKVCDLPSQSLSSSGKSESAYLPFDFNWPSFHCYSKRIKVFILGLGHRLCFRAVFVIILTRN